MIRATAGTWLNYATTLAFQVLFARAFGAGEEAAAFQLAYYLGVALFSIFVSTARTVLVPRLVLPGGALDRRTLRTLLWITGIAAAVYAVVAATAEPLAHALAGGSALTVTHLPSLLRLTALFALFQVLAGGFAAIAIARGHRFLPALAPAGPTTAGSVALLIHPDLDLTILYWLVIGGSLVQAVMVFPGLRGVRLSEPPRRERLLHVTGGTLATYVLLVVTSPLEIYIATRESAADGAHYVYAMRSLVVAQSLLIGGIIMSALGDWSAIRRDHGREELARAVSSTLRETVLILLVALAVALVVGEELVRLVYERGEFTAADTSAVYVILTIALAGFAFESTSQIVSQTLFAHRRNDLAIRVGVIRVTVRVLLVVTLAQVWGVRGVALGYSLSALLGLSLNTRYMLRLGVLTPIRIRQLARVLALAVALSGTYVFMALAAGQWPVEARLGLVLVLVAVPFTLLLRNRLGRTGGVIGA